MRTFVRGSVILAVMALLFRSSSAFAQGGQAPPPQTPPPPPPTSQGSGFHEGFGLQIIGGPLFANLTDTQGFDTSNKTGYLVGIAMGGNRGGRVGVEADVL